MTGRESLFQDAHRKLVEGTEVLRTGGGATLTAGDCNAILAEIAALREGHWTKSSGPEWRENESGYGNFDSHGTTPAPGSLRSFLRRKVAWSLARWFWTFGLNRLGDHFEDVAICGKRWLNV